MLWKLSMLCLLPIMVGRAKFRTWLALIGAGVAGSFCPPDAVFLFALIDATAAFLILRSPKSLPQRMIGLFFVGMLASHLGFTAAVLTTRDPNLMQYAEFQRWVGWVQLIVLAVWGGVDAVRSAAYRFLRFRHGLSEHGGVRT